MSSIVPSPLATGGSGAAYEQRVGALFLSYLLTRNPSQIFPDCQVEEVGFQTGRGGWRTDDILVVCSADGRRRKIAIQAKCKFTVGSNSNCARVFRRFWEDFDARDRFDSDKDALALATPLNTPNLDSLARLLDCARDSMDAEDLKNMLETPGLVQKGAGGHYRTIRHILEGAGATHDLNAEKIWRFLRSLRVLFLDFDRPSSQSMVSVMDMLSRSADGSGAADVAKATWNELVNVAASSASGARTLRHCDLPEGMRERHRSNSVPMQILSHHTKTTLSGIRTTIAGTVTLPRVGTIAEAVTALAGSRVVALTGPAGSGKSVLARRVVEQESGNRLCLSFRAEEFAHAHLDQALPGSIPASSLESIIESEDKVLIHLESLERLLESPTSDAFGDLVAMAERHPRVSLLLTCRDDDMGKAADAFFGQGQLGCHTIRMPLLDKEDIMQVAEAVPAIKVLLSRPESGQIVGTPYILDMAARMTWPDPQDIPSSMRAFRERWWSDMVRGDGKNPSGPARLREQALVNLAMRRARQMRPSVTVGDIDPETLHALRSDGLIVMGNGELAAPAHDVIEDWAVMRHVDLLAAESEWQAHPMAEDLGDSPAVRRGFRGWLRERLDAGSVEADRFVLATYGDGSLPHSFSEDVLISLLRSDSVEDFVSRQKDHLLEDDAQLLVKMVRLTRVACTKTPDASSDRPARQSMLMEPDGKAWPTLLKVITDNLESLLPAHTAPILDLLEGWSRGVVSSPALAGINQAGRITYRLLEQPGYKHEHDFQKRVLKIIARMPGADEGRFLDLVERASPDSKQHDARLDEFGRLLTNGVDGSPACRKFPEKMAQFTRSLCLISEEKPGAASASYNSIHADYEFGLRAGISFDFFPTSAHHGPFWALLTYSQDIGVDLVLDIINHAGDWYGKRKGRGYWSEFRTGSVPSITISVPSGGNVVQWADDALWQSYRGISYVPNVITCALMALEYRLLELCENQVSVEPLLLKILRSSNNVMTTAVVASVCCAYPTLGGSATLTILKSLECIMLDRNRMAKEPQSADIVFRWSDQLGRFYADERRKSNALPHRRQDLRTLAVKLQFGEKKEQVWGIIDGHRAGIHDTDRTDEDRARLLMLHGMDIRRMKRIDAPPSLDGGNTEGESGKAVLTPDTGKMDADLLRFYNTAAEESQRSSTALSLLNWGLRQREQNSGGKDTESWRQALALARDDPHYDEAQIFAYMLRQGPPVVAAVCVRDHWDEMDEVDRQWCTDTLVSEIERDGGGHHLMAYASAYPTGTGDAAFTLPSILMRNPENKRILKAVARAVTHGSAEVSVSAADGVAKYLGPQHHNLALRCAGAAAMLSNRLAQYEQQHTREIRQAESDKKHDLQKLLEYVRGAVVDGSIDAGEELAKLDIGSQRGRNATLCILPILGMAPDLPLAKAFVVRVGQAVVDAWAAERKNRAGNADSQLWDAVTERLADVLLALPSDDIPFCCKPFLDAVDEHPGKLGWFVVTLVQRGIAASAESSFWDIWRAFAGRIADASWSSDIRVHNTPSVMLVNRMLFNIDWRDNPGKLPLLIGHEDDVNKFVTRLPAAPPVLTCFARYLDSVGESALPGALKVVADRLQAGDTLDKSAVSYLVPTLQRYVYGQQQSLKADLVLKEAALAILDRLVNAGSPDAYKMLNDFTTPNAG